MNQFGIEIVIDFNPQTPYRHINHIGVAIKINIPDNKIELAVSDEVLAERKANWVPRQPKVTTGYLARYASMVTSGNRGAVLEIAR